MGNTCCGQNGQSAESEIPQMPIQESSIQVLPLQELSTQNVTLTDPQSKINEYYQILQEVQLENLNNMRKQLAKEPSIFLLNNLIMSIQFFDNFDRNKETIRQKKIEQESVVNSALADIHRRSCFYEGALTEVVGQDYRYQTTQGATLPDVFTSLRYNIIHRNLEVHPKEKYATLSVQEYTPVDDPIYRFCMEDIDQLPGYVTLRCVDLPPGHRRSEGAASASTTYAKIDDSDGYCGRASEYDSSQNHDSVHSERSEPTVKKQSIPEIARRPPMKTPVHSSSSSADEDEFSTNYPMTGKELLDNFKNRMQPHTTVPLSDDFGRDRSKPPDKMPAVRNKVKTKKRGQLTEEVSDEDYDYTSINDLPRPLKPARTSQPRNSALAPDCFHSIPFREPGSRMEFRTYLSSSSFFAQFEKSFHNWSEKVNRGLTEGMAHKAAICCTIVKSTPNCQYKSRLEFVPVIPVLQWPKIADEFRKRKREIFRDLRTDIKYVWPRRNQVKSIIDQGCHLIAEGGKTGGRVSDNSKLEWQLSFGVAHESLLSSLSECHLRALMWARLIFRYYFLDELASSSVLSSYHIETLFFSLVEENYANWQEASLGEKIKRIFEKMYEHVQKRELQHFFIHKRNLFSTKAPRDILKAQHQLFDVNNNFVPLVLKAAKQLQTSNVVFPPPDLVRLLEIVYPPNPIILTNRALTVSHRPSNSSRTSVEKKREKKAKDRSSADEKVGFWESMSKEQKVLNQQVVDPKRQQIRKEHAEKREKQVASSGTSIKMNFTPIKPFDDYQIERLLKFFIEHFINMARMSNKIRAYNKSTVLLDQAYNLGVLLREQGFGDTAKDYHDEIEALRFPLYQSGFTEPVVEIPGSPCLFRTGVETRSVPMNGIVRDSSLSNGTRPSSILSVPLPKTPIESSNDFNKVNGHVVQRSAFSYEPELSNGPLIRSMNETVKKSPNETLATITSAVIEYVPSSETELTDQFESPKPQSEVSHLKKAYPIQESESDDEDYESTDF